MLEHNENDLLRIYTFILHLGLLSEVLDVLCTFNLHLLPLIEPQLKT